MPNDSQKHLNNERLPWKQNHKRYLVHFTFSEGFYCNSKSLQYLKSLRVRVRVRVRVLEITGGGG